MQYWQIPEKIIYHGHLEPFKQQNSLHFVLGTLEENFRSKFSSRKLCFKINCHNA